MHLEPVDPAKKPPDEHIYFPLLLAFVASAMNGEFGPGTTTYGEMAARSYDEFVAWAAYFHHAQIHNADKTAQEEHDRIMAEAMRAAGG